MRVIITLNFFKMKKRTTLIFLIIFITFVLLGVFTPEKYFIVSYHDIYVLVAYHGVFYNISYIVLIVFLITLTIKFYKKRNSRN
jgi:hypothetical protein